MANQKYARVIDGVVLEIKADLPTGVTPKDAYYSEIAKQFVACPAAVDQGWTYDGKNFAAPVPVPVDLDATKSSAKAQLSTMLDAAAASLTGNAPLAEQLSWSVKQDAARAYQAGTATGEQKIILEAEASVTGETVEALCAVILASADAYALAVGKIAGLRRKVSKAIDDCDTVECVADALAAATEAIKGALTA